MLCLPYIYCFLVWQMPFFACSSVLFMFFAQQGHFPTALIWNATQRVTMLAIQFWTNSCPQPFPLFISKNRYHNLKCLVSLLQPQEVCLVFGTLQKVRNPKCPWVRVLRRFCPWRPRTGKLSIASKAIWKLKQNFAAKTVGQKTTFTTLWDQHTFHHRMFPWKVHT